MKNDDDNVDDKVVVMTSKKNLFIYDEEELHSFELKLIKKVYRHLIKCASIRK